jgi:hypothetical protein
MPLIRKKGDAATPALVNPVKLADQPDFIEAKQALDARIAAKQKIDARLRELVLLLGTPVSAEDTSSRLVDAALEFAATGVPQLPANGIGALRDEYTILNVQAEALARDIVKQRDALELIQRNRAAECFTANKGAHNEILQRAAAALRAFDAIVAEEEAFLNSMHALGYDVTPPERALWLYVGTLADPGSSISMRLRELRAYDNAA